MLSHKTELLNFDLFLARRIVSGGKAHFSRTFVTIAVTSIALGFIVMFVAIAILTGFKKEIREKVAGFSGHIQVTRFTQNSTLEPYPIEKKQSFVTQLRKNKNIANIQVFATKTGIIKTKDQIQGVVLKGVGSDFDWRFFKGKLKTGTVFSVSDTGRNNSVIISEKTANLLNLKLNDDLRMYFVSGELTLGRKFKIAGIYSTGLEEFDKMYVLGDIHHIQRLNNWTSDQVGGFEIFLRDYDTMEKMGLYIYHQVGFSLDAATIRQIYPQIFDWLDLQDVNVLIILILIIMVSTTTIISTLLILILEKTRMIGILKSLGMRNSGIKRVFFYQAFFIVGRGMIIGNLVSFLLCWLQQHFGWITLPEDSYYVSVIPIHFGLWNILALNAGTLGICYLIFLIPSVVIGRITPVKAIRFN